MQHKTQTNFTIVFSLKKYKVKYFNPSVNLTSPTITTKVQVDCQLNIKRLAST